MIRAALALLLIAAPAVADTDFDARANAVVQRYVESDGFSGAVLVALGGQPIFRRAFGYADREQRIPNTPDTKFRIGSITKSFTSAAILQLAERGKLGLDDPVSRHDAKAPPAWAKVTIRHLLSQQSGIESVSDRDDWDSWSKVHRSPEEIVEPVRRMPLRFEPGAKHEYSNSNHHILGLVIEAVTGQDYEAYMQANILDPLGMRDTGLDHNDKVLTKRALGYNFDSRAWTLADYVSMTIPYAAGSLYSTVDDLLKWDQALESEKLIGAASRQAMFTNHGGFGWADGFGWGYGFGWYVGNWFGNRVHGHTGQINGFHAVHCRYPDEKLSVTVLANVWSARVERLANELAWLHLGLIRGLGHICVT